VSQNWEFTNELEKFLGSVPSAPRFPSQYAAFLLGLLWRKDAEMIERGCSPILAVVSVCTVLFFLACPQAIFAVIAVVFSIVFLLGMVAVMVFLFGFSCYCVYEILKVLGRMLR
jgi:hypothetical protein